MARGRLRRWATTLRREALAIHIAARDPATPPLARWLALAVAAYAFSPIDLIPDVIPVLGLLDDLVLLPLGIWLVVRLVPAPVLAAARARAEVAAARPVSRAAAAAIALAWLGACVATAWWAWARFG